MDTNQELVQSQTGVPGTPIQVENVQYNVNVGKVKSKVGFAAQITFFVSWVVASIALFSSIMIRTIIAPESADDLKVAQESLVLFFALAIPLVPLFIFLVRRLRTLLVQNPASLDDITYKKGIQGHLIIALINAVVWVGIASYNILAKLLLDTEIAGVAIVDGVLFAITAAALLFFFWTYQKETKR